MKEQTPLFQLPRGVKVLPPRGAQRREWVRRTLLETFQAWGFQKVVTPTFEYLDIILKGLEEGLEDRVYKLVERETGRLIALRPDFTPQVARIAATVMKDYPRPLRLCYSGGVFRYMPHRGEEEKELHQVGVELIGLDAPEADAEMIAMAARALENLGLSDYTISVGHMGFITGIMEALPEHLVNPVKKALAEKNRSETRRICGELDHPWREILENLPTLYGHVGILEEARKLLKGQERLLAPLDYLQVLHSMVETYGLAHRVVIDLAEIRGFQYHTGMVFEVFTERTGRSLGGGGRYDQLLEKFGSPEPATGFGMNVDAILKALEQGEAPWPSFQIDYLLVDFSRDKRAALDLARRMRELGWKVARDIIKRDLAGSLEYARKMDIQFLIVMDEELKKDNQVKVIDTTSGKEYLRPAEELLVPKGG